MKILISLVVLVNAVFAVNCEERLKFSGESHQYHLIYLQCVNGIEYLFSTGTERGGLSLTGNKCECIPTPSGNLFGSKFNYSIRSIQK